ncbi:MAG: hypothetical protein QM711_16860 [Micropruina sp.]|uniref:hypothetical protein n=1 Tax=Micropruina sp. TaxID=2737536 RepID=UPI0039E3E409
MEVVARQVNHQRRLGLPRKLALLSGIEPGRFVTVGPAVACQAALAITPASADADAGSRRDPDRPRRVTSVLQVTIPKPYMERVGLEVEDWVFVGSLGIDAGLLLQPQHAVVLAPKGGSARKRVTARVQQ